MSASDGPALSAIAFQLAATLETYEEHVAALVRTPTDLDLYRRTSSDVDHMRMYAAALPAISVPWVEVLIRHFELTHGLWRAQRDSAHARELPQLHRQLRDAVRQLSRRCLHLLPSA
jgi:hypothetical protein